ncbi:MAG: Smr/MutS family protein [Rhodobacteraceae bacterium]|nr:Smr/MutS family protein [Paracoccaceae bacterium]MCY4138439.1 Smr/MutS family protein [Paracoccaceae bacterium]
MDDGGPKGLTDDDRALWISETRDVARKGATEPQPASSEQNAASAESVRKSATQEGRSREGRRTARNLISAADMEAWRAETEDLPPGNPDSGKGSGPSLPESRDSRSAAKGQPKTRGLHGTPTPLPDRFDRKLYARLARGQQKVEATLDLHGLTEKRAELRLTTFVQTAHGRGVRNLLVITGKGNRSGLDEFNRPKGGVLRRRVPDLLSRPPLSHLVQSFSESHERHGGKGALYVRLRRQRHETVPP